MLGGHPMKHLAEHISKSCLALLLLLGWGLRPETAVAQAQCPPGLEYVGRMEGSTNELEVKVWRQITLPPGFELDGSYHQASPSGSGGRAASTLPREQIPGGIHILPG